MVQSDPVVTLTSLVAVGLRVLHVNVILPAVDPIATWICSGVSAARTTDVTIKIMAKLFIYNLRIARKTKLSFFEFTEI